MFRLVVIALIVSATSGRKFQNPVSNDREYGSPGVLLYQGQYYAVSNTSPNDSGRFPIQVSSDLQTWNHAGYALPINNVPGWSDGFNFNNAELHQIGESDFRLVFTGDHTGSNTVAIGVGYSKTVLGPYIVTTQPLVSNPIRSLLEPTLVQDGARKYLIWVDDNQIVGRELKADCLSFIEGSEEKLVMSTDAQAIYLSSPWYVRRPDGWYMFYNRNFNSIGVARSLKPLGPFVKRSDPILVATDAFVNPGYCSVVPDIFISMAVMVYQAKPADTNVIYMMAQSVEWGSDGWPYMNPN